MNSRKNIGIVVAVLGLLLTCCACLPALNSLVYLVTLSTGRPVSILNQLVIELTKGSPRTLLQVSRTVSVVFNLPVVCTGVLALIVLVIGIVVLVQAKGNGAKTELPGGDVPTR
jgi:energy-converting hydrogenase Eha subunit A